MKKYAAILISALVFSYNVTSAPVQWRIADGGNDHYYERVPVAGNIHWVDANTAAEDRSYNGLSGHLATITSPEEQDFIISNLGGSALLNEYWLGGYQPPGSPEPGGNWRWVTGEPWSYTNWAPTEPTDSYDGHTPSIPRGSDEEALQFHRGTGEWNDNDEYDMQPGYIVEYEQEQESWSFVHISDTHIGARGKNCVPVGMSGLRCRPWSARTNLAALLRKVVREVKPRFIVNTGDVADFGCSFRRRYIPILGVWVDIEECANGPYRCYDQVIEQWCTEAGVEVYNIVGNHDQRGPWPHGSVCSETFPICFNAAHKPKNWFSYGRSTFCPDGRLLFITLNTGYGNCSGVLRDEDISFLKGLKKDIPKIILTHHPPVAGESDREGISEVCRGVMHVRIEEGRGEFLDYCRKESNNKVLAVLSGHTHTNREYNENLETPTDYPQYIITGTAGKANVAKGKYPVFRKIDVIGDRLHVNPVTHLTERDYNCISYQICSSANLHVYDSNGRHTGYDSVNGFERGIPDSVYFGHYELHDANGISCIPEEIMIFDPCDAYLSRVVGAEAGPYRLEIRSLADGTELLFEANSVPSLPGAVHDYVVDWQVFSDSNGEEGVTVDIDGNGDGDFEVSLTTGAELTGNDIVTQYQVLDDYLSIRVGNAGYDHKREEVNLDLTLTNISDEIVIGVPLYVELKSASDPNVTLASGESGRARGRPWADVSDMLGDGRLDPGETVTGRVALKNPEGIRFTFELSVRGIILEPVEGAGLRGLRRMSDNWLKDEPSFDVAPASGDGIVNFRDFAVLAGDWLDDTSP